MRKDRKQRLRMSLICWASEQTWRAWPQAHLVSGTVQLLAPRVSFCRWLTVAQSHTLVQ